MICSLGREMWDVGKERLGREGVGHEEAMRDKQEGPWGCQNGGQKKRGGLDRSLLLLCVSGL